MPKARTPEFDPPTDDLFYDDNLDFGYMRGLTPTDDVMAALEASLNSRSRKQRDRTLDHLEEEEEDSKTEAFAVI